MMNVKYTAKLDGEQYTVDIKLREKISIVKGDSGSGKTLIRRLQNLSKDDSARKISCYGYENLNVMVDIINSEPKGFKVSDKVIMIDNADLYFEKIPELKDIINNDRNNKYILFIRKPQSGLVVTPNSLSEMQYDAENKTFSLKYRYPEGVWG